MLPFSMLLLLIPIKLAALFILMRGTFSGELKPSRVSLLLWSIPSMLGFAIAFTAGATFSAIPIFLAGAAPLFILFLSFISKHKAWKTRPIDYISAFFSILAIIFWLATNNPLVATFFIIFADICAGIPTFIKTWSKPKTESVWVYFLGMLANVIGLSTLQVWNFTTAGFSVYLLLFSVSMIGIITHKKIIRLIRSL